MSTSIVLYAFKARMSSSPIVTSDVTVVAFVGSTTCKRCASLRNKRACQPNLPGIVAAPKRAYTKRRVLPVAPLAERDGSDESMTDVTTPIEVTADAQAVIDSAPILSPVDFALASSLLVENFVRLSRHFF